MRQVDESGIRQASADWSWKRDRIFADDEIVSCTLDSILRIASVWAIDKGWQERASDEKFADTAASLKKFGWELSHPAIIGIATNGLVTLLDGNHRITTIVFADNLYSRIPYVPTKFHFFDVGMSINPVAPDRKWDGANLNFLCFPRGSCKKCTGCRRMLPEVRERLSALGIAE